MINEAAPDPQNFSDERIRQISKCRYCTKISEEKTTTPISCTKYAGSSVPISVNLATCLTCKEYERT